jgi:hypothetical protein
LAIGDRVVGYVVKFVEDWELPGECGWAAVRDAVGHCYLFVKLAACRVLDGCLRPPTAAIEAVMSMLGLLARG